ncbi:hypothetical protein MIDIC_140076 [Alphaproteobacteria bacterium]
MSTKRSLRLLLFCVLITVNVGCSFRPFYGVPEEIEEESALGYDGVELSQKLVKNLKLDKFLPENQDSNLQGKFDNFHYHLKHKIELMLSKLRSLNVSYADENLLSIKYKIESMPFVVQQDLSFVRKKVFVTLYYDISTSCSAQTNCVSSILHRRKIKAFDSFQVPTLGHEYVYLLKKNLDGIADSLVFKLQNELTTSTKSAFKGEHTHSKN